jgi:hypothetical protein
MSEIVHNFVPVLFRQRDIQLLESARFRWVDFVELLIRSHNRVGAATTQRIFYSHLICLQKRIN